MPSRSWLGTFRLPCAIAFLLSFLTVAVYVSVWNEEREPFDDLTEVMIAGALVALWVILAVVLAALFKKAEQSAPGSRADVDGGMSFRWSARGILAASGSIWLLWLPMVASAYPCAMDWDTLNQLFQYATDAPVNYGARAVDLMVDAKFIDHDPVITTLLFGAFWQIGDFLGDQSGGLFLYVIFQSLFSAFALGLLCCYVRRLGFSRRAVWLAFAFCALCPVLSRFSATMIKDSLFAPFFLLYAVGFVEVFRTKGLALESKRWWLLLALAALGCVLSRKTGLYIVLISAAVMALCFRRQWKQAAAAGLAPALAVLLMPAILYPALGVGSVGRQEAFAVPFQQSAAVLIEHADDVRPWEHEALEAVYDCEALDERFDPELADPVKAGFNSSADTSDLVRFLLAYVSMGLRHPGLYLDVVLKLDGPMLVPMSALSVPMWTGDEGIAEMAAYEGAAPIDFSKPEWDKQLFTLANHFGWWFVSMMGLFGTMGFYGGWLPITASAVVFARNQPMSWALTPVVISVLFLLLSPVSVTRYVLPLVYCAPLLVALTVDTLRLQNGVLNAS